MELEQANIADSDKRFASHRSKAESHLELIISIYDDFISEINDIMGAHCVSDVHATSEAKTFDEEKSDDEGGQKAESELDSQIEMMTALNQIQEDFEVSMNRQINNSLVKERQRLHDFGREKILYIVNFSQTEKAAIDEWILHNEDDYFASKNKTFDTSILALNCDALHLVSAGQGSTSRSSDSRGSRKGSSRSSRGQLSSRKGTAGKSSARSTSRGPSTSRGNGASTHRSIK